MASNPLRRGLRRVFQKRLACSFCGREANCVARLVAGVSAHICDECVAKCAAVLEQHGGLTIAAPDALQPISK
jgi:hypothetical protein